MNGLINGSIANSNRRQSRAAKAESSRTTPLESNNPSLKTFSLTRRIIVAVVACQVLLTVGLTLVAVLYARAQLRGTFDTALDGNSMGALALVRYTETDPHVLMFDPKLLPPSLDQAH